MSFPMKQKFSSCCSFPAVERVGSFSPSGVYHEEFKDFSSVKLPDCDSTDLGKLIDAGVDLKQMNTKILNVRSVSLPEEKQTSKTNNKQNNEVNDEN